MKNLNLPLFIGLSIFTAILLVTIFPGVVTNQSPYVMQSLRSWIENGSLEFQKAPFPPSEFNPLGTDEIGRDIWSRIAYGSKLTLALGVLIVLGRFAIALPVGLAAGFGNSAAKSALRLGGLVFSAIPALLFAVIILRQEFFVSLDKSKSITAFVLILSVVGWPKLGLVLSEKTVDILGQPFILSERAIGKGGLHIAWENVLPHLAPETVILFFMELARALSMVMQLGIFSVFIGIVRVVKSTDGGNVSYMDISFEPEWAGMLGTARNRLSTAPWMVIWPTLAFFICVFASNLIGEGLRRYFQGNSPRIRNLSGNHLRVFRIALPVILLAVLIPTLIHPAVKGPSLANQHREMIEPLIPEKPVSENTLLEIVNRMKEAGMVPVDDSGFVRSYHTETTGYLSSSELSIETENTVIRGIEGVDYRIIRVSHGFSDVLLADTTDLDLFSLPDISRSEGSIALIDGRLYSDEGLDWILEKSMAQPGFRGALVIDPGIGTRELDRIMTRDRDDLLIKISPDFAMRLTDKGDMRISVSAEITDIRSERQNIMGMLPGTDPILKRETVAIALRLNRADSGLALMEYLTASGMNRRSYVFLFLDGTSSDTFHGIRAFENNLPFEAAHAMLYLDLSAVHSENFEYLVINTEQSPITRYYAWSFGYMLGEILEDTEIPIRKESMVNRGGAYDYKDLESADIMFWKHGVPSIRIATSGEGTDEYRTDELMATIARILERNDI